MRKRSRRLSVTQPHQLIMAMMRERRVSRRVRLASCACRLRPHERPLRLPCTEVQGGQRSNQQLAVASCWPAVPFEDIPQQQPVGVGCRRSVRLADTPQQQMRQCGLLLGHSPKQSARRSANTASAKNEQASWLHASLPISQRVQGGRRHASLPPPHTFTKGSTEGSAMPFLDFSVAPRFDLNRVSSTLFTFCGPGMQEGKAAAPA
jgi:hypothetical protein